MAEGRPRQRSLAEVLRRNGGQEEGKLRRWRSAAHKWLNGIPINEEDEDDDDRTAEPASLRNQLRRSRREHSRAKQRQFIRSLNPARWLPSLPPSLRGRTKSRDPEAMVEVISKEEDALCSPRQKGLAPGAPAGEGVSCARATSETSLLSTAPDSQSRGSEAQLLAPIPRLTQQQLYDDRAPVRIIQLPPEHGYGGMAKANKDDDVVSSMITNEIHTAKYTVFNFLPKTIAEQLRRVANIYFVLIVFLQCFPAISNYNPILSALPIIVIMAVTAIKDAGEDWRRHQQDADVNYSVTLTLNRPGCEQVVVQRTRWQHFKLFLGGAISTGYKSLIGLYGQLFKKPIQQSLGRQRALAQVPADAIEWKETFWRDIKVGDFVLLHNNEMIPADIMVIATSEEEGMCFVETKNLDGETNLKVRKSPVETEWIKRAEDAFHFKATVEVELPNPSLYYFRGKIIISKEVPSPVSDHGHSTAPLEASLGSGNDKGDEKTPADPRRSMLASQREMAVQQEHPPSLDLEEEGRSRESLCGGGESTYLEPTVIPITSDGVILRGCIIRNTAYVIGVAVYTGSDTKLMLNSGGTPSKRTRIERQMNPQIILNFILLFVICFSCAIVQSQLSTQSENAPYLTSAFDKSIMSSGAFLGFLTFWSCIILFQTLVPISMYVTVELVKTIQAFFINNDVQMYYAESNTRAVPRAWNLADDLGQIEYLFSDKTGTLTQNVMEFRRCSIGGQVYGSLANEVLLEDHHRDASKLPPAPSTSSSDSPRLGLSRSTSTIFHQDARVDEKRWSHLEQSMIEHLSSMLPYKYVPPVKYSFVDASLFKDIATSVEEHRRRIFSFFLVLVVCHTVLIDLEEGEDGVEEYSEKSREGLHPHNLLFKSQSPDEAALVAAARDLGFVFLGRDRDVIFVSLMGNVEPIKVMNILEFNSDRKRMSAIVRRTSGEILLLCKGADNVIYERLSEESLASEASHVNQRHLELFAEDEYYDWLPGYSEACAAIENRDLMMDAMADEIERGLTLLGSTAIEDRLQEGVPECIETLQQAGIKIWVLTGDKLETAINIGFSCRLLRKEMVLFVIRADTPEDTLAQLKGAYEKIWGRFYAFGEASLPFADSFGGGSATAPVHGGEGGLDGPMGGGDVKFALIIEGATLKYALDKRCRRVFLDLTSRCKAVICCRVSPLQKAKVVELVRHGGNAMTLAIGDGANDVSMIQAADIGVGISGQEGMQAVMSSDYAISQFRYLTRLLLIHGRWSYLRVAEVTLCSLYKNIAFVVLLFWYQFYCGFTAQYVYDYMYLLFFNLFFSILPLIMMGSFERDLYGGDLIAFPRIYEQGIRQQSYSMRHFLLYTLDGFYQSLICIFIPLYSFKDTAMTSGGHPESLSMLGTVMATTVIVCTNVYAAINTYSWTWMMAAGMVVTIVTLFAFTVVFSTIPTEGLYGQLTIFANVAFWATFLLTLSAALSPRLLIKYIQCVIWPTDLDIVREIRKFSLAQEAVPSLAADAMAAPMLSSFSAGEATHHLSSRLGAHPHPLDGCGLGLHNVLPLADGLQEPPRAILREHPRRLLGVVGLSSSSANLGDGEGPFSKESGSSGAELEGLLEKRPYGLAGGPGMGEHGDLAAILGGERLPFSAFDYAIAERGDREEWAASPSPCLGAAAPPLPDGAEEAARGSKRGPRRILEKSLALFNLRSRKYERMGGYAFSQENSSGIGRWILRHASRKSTPSKAKARGSGTTGLLASSGTRRDATPHPTQFGTVYLEATAAAAASWKQQRGAPSGDAAGARRDERHPDAPRHAGATTIAGAAAQFQEAIPAIDGDDRPSGGAFAK